MRARTGLSLLAATLATGLAACGGSSGGQVRLSALPADALVDAPVTIRVRNAPAGSRVTLVATAKDVSGNPWQSSAVFAADAHGDVDVAHDPSLSGTYEGQDAMGLFWSMHEVGSQTPVDAQYLTPPKVLQVTLQATVRGRTVASTTLRRRLVASDIHLQQETLAKQGFVGCFWSKQHPGQREPAVLEIGGSEGGLDCGVGLLAAHGYPELHVGYFGLAGLPQYLERIPLSYFAHALRWLARQPGVDPHRIVIEGVSRGAEAAILTAAAYPSLVHGAVEYVGSATVAGGNGPTGAAAWTVRGRPVPAGTELPVWKVNGPLLLIGGDADLIKASGLAAQNMAAALRAHGRHDFTLLDYKHAGHLLDSWWPYVSAGTALPDGTTGGGTFAGTAHARADSWQELLSFLGRLKPQTAGS